MALRIGIAVAPGWVRAVVVRGQRVIASTELGITPDDPLHEVVAEALAAAPVPSFPRPRVTVALGPSLSQVRRLTGLPPLRDRRVLGQVVREGASSFFLTAGAPVLTTAVRVEVPGEVWAAALDEASARGVEAGCGSAGLEVSAFVPSVVALGHLMRDGRHRWTDGTSTAELEVAGGELTAVRRVPAGALPAEGGVPAPELAFLGEHAWSFMDAYAAALLPQGEPLVVRRGEGGWMKADVPPWRIGLATGAAVLALAFAGLAPAWRALHAADAASARTALVQREQRAAAHSRRVLARTTAALGEAVSFGAARRSPTRLLAELNRTLPEGAALVALRVDTAGGSIVALAPRAATVVAAIEKAPGIVSPEIVGPVTREAAAGRQVERVSVRFRFAQPARGR